MPQPARFCYYFLQNGQAEKLGATLEWQVVTHTSPTGASTSETLFDSDGGPLTEEIGLKIITTAKIFK